MTPTISVLRRPSQTSGSAATCWYQVEGEAAERQRGEAVDVEGEDEARGDRREDEGEGQDDVGPEAPVDRRAAVEVAHRPRSL